MWLGGHLIMWVFGFEWNTWEINVALVLEEGKRGEDKRVFFFSSLKRLGFLVFCESFCLNN